MTAYRGSCLLTCCGGRSAPYSEGEGLPVVRRAAEPYRFVGTERELVDPARYERALRAWTGYLLERLAEEQVKRRRDAGKAG